MSKPLYKVRTAILQDIPGIIMLCKEVYPESFPWSEVQLSSHQKIFPEGQLVAVRLSDQKVVGMASSLIVNWDDYEWTTPWRDFTDHGMFTNHDPIQGRTLYGAEIMVSPSCQGTGVGKHLYKAREDIAIKFSLLRIRAGARLRNYHKFAQKLSAEEYVLSVVEHRHRDPTLSFQLNRGFHVLKVVGGYLLHDPESLGFAAVIEWINPEIAKPEDYRYLKQSKYYKK